MNKLVSKFFADAVFSVSFFMETEAMTEVEQLPMFDNCFANPNVLQDLKTFNIMFCLSNFVS